MNDFSADLAHGPLKIASYLTSTSQPVWRNHGTRRRGLSPPKAPSKKMVVYGEGAHDTAYHIFENLPGATFP